MSYASALHILAGNRLMLRATILALLLTTAAAPSLAQKSMPQPVPFDATIPEARDLPFPGTIMLNVDASDVRQGIFRVKESVPVADAGPMVLLFPKWLPGAHGPRGEIEKLAGLKIRANGKVVPWTRDTVDVYAFHVDVPAGAKVLDVEFQFISATSGNQGRIVMTPNMLNLQWNSVSLYPAGYFTRRIPVQATAVYPDGWAAASGLPAKAKGAVYTYDKTDYETLVDSPVFAGKYYREIALSPKVDMNVFADWPEELAATDDQIAKHKAMVEQTVKLYGAEHYDHYELLVAISNELGGIGLEHHRSSENQVEPGYFIKWGEVLNDYNTLPHEFDHSWIGKYRRGADLWTPDFRTPMRDDLLWAYEGQDQFWGYVLGARSGMFTKQQTLDALAGIAAGLDSRPARSWRNLVDTTNDPIISARRPKGWISWQRSEDYYNEGMLVWLEVDSILRAQSGGTKSMDDFGRAFAGMKDGDWGVLTYNFDDVVRTLNDIVPYDWKTLLTARLTETGDHAPLAGFVGNGYKLVFTDMPTPWFKADEKSREQTNLRYSVGLILGKGSAISEVLWDGPAFNAGLDLGDELIAVNGMAFNGQRMKDSIAWAAAHKDPIRLVVKNGDRYREVTIDYHGGLRYPRLEKTAPGEAGLDRLLEAR
jgi:predicted metalloprotease with PDZ domain